MEDTYIHIPMAGCIYYIYIVYRHGGSSLLGIVLPWGGSLKRYSMVLEITMFPYYAYDS